MNEASKYPKNSRTRELDKGFQASARLGRIAVPMVAAEMATLLTLGALNASTLGWTVTTLGLLLTIFIAFLLYRSNFFEQLYWLNMQMDDAKANLGDVVIQSSRLERRLEQILKRRITRDSPTSIDEREIESHSKPARLVANVALIERAASRLLSSDEGPDGAPKKDTYRSIFDLRSELRSKGIWSNEDVVGFDKALRVRNAIVHGDSIRELDSIGEAIATTNELLRALGAKNLNPDHLTPDEE